MKTTTGAKWKPRCDQLQAACKVCFYGDCTMAKECTKCMYEDESGFVFDPDKYMEMYNTFTKKRYFFTGEGNAVRLDLRRESEELEAAKADRDYWKCLADHAIQQILNIFERIVDSKIK